MPATSLRVLAILAAASAGGSAMAETYTAKIFGTPGGFLKMTVFGAGDNGLMSGSVSNGTTWQAAYLTAAGGYKNMHPAGWHRSEIADSWASTYHCGHGEPVQGGGSRALFWVGGGAAVNIHPAGSEYLASEAHGGGGQLQAGLVIGDIACGQCGFSTIAHAGSWSRTAASFKRLHSTTHKDTFGESTDGTSFVGYGTHRTDNSRNALLWKSATAFSTNIRPSGSTESIAQTVWGNQQGGYFVGIGTGSKRHAVIWSGTAASAVDLHPSVFEHTVVTAVRAGLQVGHGNPLSNPTRDQAIAWHGSSATWINLHARLPYPYNLWSSVAQDIDNQGNVTGYIMSPTGPDVRPVTWVRS